MISLILPYWNRQRAADIGLASIAKCYTGMNLEVIVVDDGSDIAFEPPSLSIDVRVISLPIKREPKSPVVPWNVGVEKAKGEFIALSCVEVIHMEPVLEQLAMQAEALGEKGYALAAAWCPDTREWHCHSSRKLEYCPPGTGLSFLGVMRKSLYQSIGGFDERYRDGAGWEDRDFINRLYLEGAVFTICDNLVINHPKADATIRWGREKFARNEELFKRRWNAKYHLYRN
jgi:glycosyltransferase involved in cell wall biosynthesis